MQFLFHLQMYGVRTVLALTISFTLCIRQEFVTEKNTLRKAKS